VLNYFLNALRLIHFAYHSTATLSAVINISAEPIRDKNAICAPHDLRRTFATAMLDNGEDLITVKDAMGHAKVTTTQQYDRRGEVHLRSARDRLDLM